MSYRLINVKLGETRILYIFTNIEDLVVPGHHVTDAHDKGGDKVRVQPRRQDLPQGGRR